MSNVSAILLAGGRGNRFGSVTPKQFLELLGKPVAQHSFEKFLKVPRIKEIIVVCLPQYQTFFTSSDIPVKFALPGNLRQESVYNGLQATGENCELVLVHDSARPLISLPTIEKVIDQATEHKAATIGVPVKFTIKEIDNKHFVTTTPDRSKLWEIQTPQVIEKKLLLKGYEKILKENLTVTDDVSIVELLGCRVKIVMGEYQNIKITTIEDFTTIESLAVR